MTWQPIETRPNPKHGVTADDSHEWKCFLVWVPDNRCTYQVVSRYGELHNWVGLKDGFEFAPSHWMPMPDPPKEQP